MKIYPVVSEEEEIVAVIMAVIQAYCGTDVKIRTIKRADTDSNWAKGARGPEIPVGQYFPWG